MEKICIIGNGVHATQNIIPSFRELGNSINAIASEYLREEKEYMGIKAYYDYKQMLEEEKPNIIFVVKTAENQYEITKYCIQHNIKKIFVEKPMGMNVEEAKELQKLANEYNSKLFVGFMKRYSPCYLLMKEIANKNEFGKIKHFSAEFYITSGREGWNDEIFLKKGGIHFVNLLIWLFGEVEDVKTFSNSVDNNVSMTSIIRFKNGVVGNINFIGLTSWKGKRETITITGENGYVYNKGVRELYYHIDKPINTKQRWKTVDEEITKVQPYLTSASGGVQDLYLHGYINEIDSFLNNYIDDNENIKTMELIDKILLK